MSVNLSYKEFLPDLLDYEIKTYSVKVVGVSDASREWKDSPWDNIEISWENSENPDRVNPWEVLPEVEETNPLFQALKSFKPPSLHEGTIINIIIINIITIIHNKIILKESHAKLRPYWRTLLKMAIN